LFRDTDSENRKGGRQLASDDLRDSDQHGPPHVILFIYDPVFVTLVEAAECARDGERVLRKVCGFGGLARNRYYFF
jgi:hypothetical protein